MLRYLALTVSLLGLVVPSAATAEGREAVATMFCTFLSPDHKPYVATEIEMYSMDEFSDYIKISYLQGETIKTRESLKTRAPLEQQLWSFVISEEHPEDAMHMAVFDKIIDPNEVIERYYSIAYLKRDSDYGHEGSCFVD